MSYKLLYNDEAREQLKTLDKSVLIPILKKAAQIQHNPSIGNPLSNLLKNKRSVHVGKYRIVYIVVGEDITIVRVRHRKDVYE